ncbi:MAG: hypothetical protein RLZZ230_632 [Candidatus Parcubacteria bacterium]
MVKSEKVLIKEAIKEKGGACQKCMYRESFVTRIGNCLTVTVANISVKVACVAARSEVEMKTNKKSTPNECVHFQRMTKVNNKKLFT